MGSQRHRTCTYVQIFIQESARPTPSGMAWGGERGAVSVAPLERSDSDSGRSRRDVTRPALTGRDLTGRDGTGRGSAAHEGGDPFEFLGGAEFHDDLALLLRLQADQHAGSVAFLEGLLQFHEVRGLAVRGRGLGVSGETTAPARCREQRRRRGHRVTSRRSLAASGVSGQSEGAQRRSGGSERSAVARSGQRTHAITRAERGSSRRC